MRWKAAITSRPPFTDTGLVVVWVGMSTDIPGSKRMPLLAMVRVTVTLYNAIKSNNINVNNKFLLFHPAKLYTHSAKK